jgi:low affinity Fe/Cu permease
MQLRTIRPGTTASIAHSGFMGEHKLQPLDLSADLPMRLQVQHRLQILLTAAGTWMARPAAFGFVAIYAVLWLIFDRESFNFHGAIALVTLCMTLFIQRSEHRDTQAIQAKLDELLRSESNARTSLTGLDDQEPEQIEAHRARAKARDW